MFLYLCYKNNYNQGYSGGGAGKTFFLQVDHNIFLSYLRDTFYSLTKFKVIFQI